MDTITKNNSPGYISPSSFRNGVGMPPECFAHLSEEAAEPTPGTEKKGDGRIGPQGSQGGAPGAQRKYAFSPSAPESC